MKVLLDTNVVLDLLLAREPFVDLAKEIFSLIENTEVEGYLCATSVTTLHYLIGRAMNKKEADEIIEKLLTLFEVTPVTKKVLYDASIDNGVDYEDSVIYTSAYHSQINIIVTRDKRGFKTSKVSSLTPKEFLAFFESRE
ncbi:MAG: Putative nucleic acid-binding protein, contains PIN domain [uncultured Sulfurovum sp.]|uniref:Nucleic acid-binding protein, contains PIN domain n=1 Tax=uncultured Sulfurovum sp. TaxID=269237 RepID=A0A6S6TX86_9BACT|nr:MAG: Putative nucleic acid-binding protein, contains PIN domain [uncultured Sulfurovum sp.]